MLASNSDPRAERVGPGGPGPCPLAWQPRPGELSPLSTNPTTNLRFEHDPTSSLFKCCVPHHTKPSHSSQPSLMSFHGPGRPPSLPTDRTWQLLSVLTHQSPPLSTPGWSGASSWILQVKLWESAVSRVYPVRARLLKARDLIHGNSPEFADIALPVACSPKRNL
jgi:hypothetical protein